VSGARIAAALAALAVVALSAGCAPVPARPAPVAKHERPPPIGAPRAFALPAKRDLTLSNGLRVTLVPFGTVPKSAVLLTLRTGNVADGGKAGLADLAAEMLKEGAGRRDAAALARFAADMGGALEVGATPDQTTLALDVLSDRATDAVALLADVVRRPLLPAAELARLKADLTRQTAIARSQAQALAREAFAHLVWGEHPYGHELPSDAEIAAISIADVRGFVAREYGAARAHLFVAGQFDAAAVERALRTEFGDWAPGPAPVAHPATGSRARVVRLLDRPGAGQSTIVLGLPVPGPTTPGFMGLSVANALLGGSLLSRLDQNLREDKGWTYGASSRITPLAEGAAVWTLSTDINAPDTAPALGEIFRELERLRAEPPPAGELKSIQNYRAGNFVLGASSRGGLLAQLAFIDLQGLPDEWLTHYVQRVFGVTQDEVRAAAARHLDPAAMTLVVVGDLAKLKPAILALPALKGARVE
jgi:zinc protease